MKEKFNKKDDDVYNPQSVSMKKQKVENPFKVTTGLDFSPSIQAINSKIDEMITRAFTQWFGDLN